MVTARWDNCEDVLDEGVTGYGYEMGNVQELTSCLECIYKDSKQFISMKADCVKKTSEFMPEKIMKIMLRRLN